MNENHKIEIPQWTWEFHGHKCPFMPIGYRMGLIALRELSLEKIKDHNAIVLSEMGVGHPQTCMIDGLMSSTGCTYGKLLLERLNYGKIAMCLVSPGKDTIRISLRREFQDQLSKQDFFNYRKQKIEPSNIPEPVADSAIKLVLETNEDKMFKIEFLKNFSFTRPKGSFSKVVCENCGEYVFERYARLKDGKIYCIPCSEYTETRVNILHGIQ